MLIELTSAQEEALLADVSDYLEVSLNANNGLVYESVTPDPQSGAALLSAGPSPASETVRSEDPLNLEPEKPDASAAGAIPKGQYVSPSGALYATKVRSFRISFEFSNVVKYVTT